MKRTGVIGGGSWATAIVKILSNNIDCFTWWMRDDNQREYVVGHNHNPKYLQSVVINNNIVTATTDLKLTIKESDILIIATPSAFIDETLMQFSKEDFKGKYIVSAVKGIIPQTNEIPVDYFQNKFDVPFENIGIISGPCHAEEVALEKLSYLTIASPNKSLADQVANNLSCRYIKCSVSDDLIGTEISAVLKNVYALAGGICHGLGYGDNFQAVLMSNAIQEISRFVDVVHPIHRDVKSSAYLGDLLVTGYSLYSRNRTFGNMIGKGYSVRAAQLEMNMIAEGYYAVKSLSIVKDEFKIEMPILECVYSILYQNARPRKTIQDLTDVLD
jgi:glycerol-3-phosphate dehydrogenase (NAD(P)+)